MLLLLLLPLLLLPPFFSGWGGVAGSRGRSLRPQTFTTPERLWFFALRRVFLSLGRIFLALGRIFFRLGRIIFGSSELNPSFAPVNPSFAPKHPPPTRPGRPVFCPADFFLPQGARKTKVSTDRGPGGREDRGGAARQGAREGVGAGAAAAAAGHSRAPCLLLSPFPSPSLFPRRLAVPPPLHAPTAFPVLVFLTYR